MNVSLPPLIEFIISRNEGYILFENLLQPRDCFNLVEAFSINNTWVNKKANRYVPKRSYAYYDIEMRRMKIEMDRMILRDIEEAKMEIEVDYPTKKQKNQLKYGSNYHEGKWSRKKYY